GNGLIRIRRRAVRWRPSGRLGQLRLARQVGDRPRTTLCQPARESKAPIERPNIRDRIETALKALPQTVGEAVAEQLAPLRVKAGLRHAHSPAHASAFGARRPRMSAVAE